jgi:GDPmannose 4,6-dehydratase
MTVIIFGAEGQDGFYLRQLLESEHITVVSIGRSTEANMQDVRNFRFVETLIREKKPAFIFHLAANSTTNHAALFENHATILTGTLNILEAVRLHSPDTKIFLTGSGLQFKNENRPIRESDAFEARDAYSMSRIHSVYAARYFRTVGLNIYVGYLFNHDSPHRTERHMARKITEFTKKVAKGEESKIEIGDIKVVKEWTFAGDIVKGIWQFVNQEKIFEINIASGQGYSIADWLKVCFDQIGKNWQDYVLLKKGFISEYRSLVADPELIHSIGWKPEVSFEQLSKMMVAQ